MKFINRIANPSGGRRTDLGGGRFSGAGLQILLAFSIVFSTGCGAHFTSIFRKFDVQHEQQSISVDAKQRVIITVQPPPWKGSDGTIYTPRPVVCAEPSPDALSVLSAAFSGSGEAPQQFLVKLAANLAESGTNIGLRTQTITILRDAMYRLCEGYLGEALTQTSFERLQRRYQNAMVGLLAIEQLTGAVAVKQVVLTTSATADTSTRGEGGKPAGESGKGGTKSEDSGMAGGEGAKADATKKKAETPGGTGQSPRAETGGTGSIEGLSNRSVLTAEAIGKIGDTVAKVVAAVVNANYTEETCLQYLIDSSKPEQKITPNTDVIGFCLKVLESQKASLQKRIEAIPK